MPNIQKPTVEKKVEHLVFQVANDYKPSASDKRDQIHVNCSRKILFDDLSSDNKESQNIFLCNKNFNPNQRLNDNVETTSEISCDVTRLNLTDCSEIQNEPMPKDYTFERENSFENENFQTTSNLAINKLHFQNSNERKPPIQNEMTLAHNTNEITGRSCSEFKKQDSLLTDNLANEPVNYPPRRKFNSINEYTIESHLKTFAIRSDVIEGRILSRIDEWICCFTQTMELVLAQILQNHDVSSISRPAWTLPEAINSIKELFDKNNTIKMITLKLSSLLIANSNSNGEIITTVSPNTFMRMLGCGILLVKSLKRTIRNSPEMLEGEKNLEMLLQNIERPSSEIDLSQLAQTPVVSTSELTEPPVHRRNCKLFI